MILIFDLDHKKWSFPTYVCRAFSIFVNGPMRSESWTFLLLFVWSVTSERPVNSLPFTSFVGHVIQVTGANSTLLAIHPYVTFCSSHWKWLKPGAIWIINNKTCSLYQLTYSAMFEFPRKNISGPLTKNHLCIRQVGWSCELNKKKISFFFSISLSLYFRVFLLEMRIWK